MISVKNVTKKFGAHTVLGGVSLEITAKNIVGLAGASGGGKSTLLRALQGLVKPDTGSIECGGATSFMFQDFQLFPHMTVLENLTYAPRLAFKGEDHEVTAIRLLKQLGIADKADALPVKLSGGQKQRVALARALMMRPQVLLCDEPTSGLDVATIQDVVALLQSVREMGVTMVIASHDLDFLTKIADRIVVLKGGTISADVRPGEMEDPIGFLKGCY